MSNVHFLFCSDPLIPKQPDSAFERETSAAQKLGLTFALVDFETLTSGHDANRAVRRVSSQPCESLSIYRGWMLKATAYASLYDALLTKGVRLINDPVAYRHCHYLPDSYAKIEGHTPRSVWLPMADRPNLDMIMEVIKPFGRSPIIVKDFVKSRKHEWHEACFIPSASDRTAVERVVGRLIELQEDDLNEGLVFREFIQFEPLVDHDRSGMPLTKEFRLFFLDGEPFFSTEYWDQGDYHGSSPPIEQFAKIGRSIESRFFTMDVAQRPGGEWIIVELGDGQVAGLPDNCDVEKFYELLVSRWPEF